MFTEFFDEFSCSKRREAFFNFYGLCAGSHFGKGSHDEFNVWALLNQLRFEECGLGHHILGYFDGHALGFDVWKNTVTSGYASE